jgi:hypothetical protein
MGKALKPFLLETDTKGNSSKVRRKASEYITIKMVVVMKGIGNKTKKMEKENFISSTNLSNRINLILVYLGFMFNRYKLANLMHITQMMKLLSKLIIFCL